MAPAKSSPDRWKNKNPLPWSVPVSSISSAPTGGTSPYAEPADFDQISPVSRPEVPDIEQQLPQNAKDESLLGGFLNIMDNIVPDDMGGMIRGTSGWMSNVPLYEETVGRVAGAPLSVAESTMNVINWGSEQMNHLGAALFSVLPGGIQTLDWDQSHNVSFGQVVIANAAINNDSGFAGALINLATLQTPVSIATNIGESTDPTNPLYSNKFNILDAEQRREAFEVDGFGKFASGTADAIWLVAADPTIVGGKLTAPLRFGIKTGEFAGLTNQALRTAGQQERFAGKLAEQAKIIEDAGSIEAARASGLIEAEGENLIAALEGNVDDLVNHVWVKNSLAERETRSLLAATSVDRPMEAAELVGALAGDPAAWGKLRTSNAGLYDAAASAVNVDVFAPVGKNADDIVTAGVKQTDDQAALLDDIGEEALVIAGRDDLLSSGQLITRGGAAVAPRTVRAANAYRAGARKSQFSNKPFVKSSAVSSANKGHFVYETIESFAGSRPIQVVRWLGQGTPNGIVNIKDGADGQSSLDEVTAWLRKSPLDDDTSAAYINKFASARNPGERNLILSSMEDEVVRVIAGRKGISPEKARKLYDGYNSRRKAALETAAKSKNNFWVDPETNKIVKVPDFYAELDQAFPMLDLKMFKRVIDTNHPTLRVIEDIDLTANYLNSLWKISVLTRLGYTQRNLAEGALRSFAVLGAVAANPKAWTVLPANMYYTAGARRAIKSSRLKEKLLLDSYENLQAARNVLSESVSASKYDKIVDLEKMADDFKSQIEEIRAAAFPSGAMQPRKFTSAEKKQLKKLEGAEKANRTKAAKLRAEKYDPMLDQITRDRDKVTLIESEIDNLSKVVQEAIDLARTKSAKRKIGGKQSNVMGYDAAGEPIYYAGAFEGREGSLAAMASSSDQTAYMTFDAAAGRRVAALDDVAAYKLMDPSKLKPGQMQRYFDEYAARINKRYSDDVVGRMVLENRPVDDIKAWFKSSDASEYRKALSTKDRPITNEQEMDAFIDEIIRRLDTEMPKDSGLRELALDHALTPGEVAAALKGRDLPSITGRLNDIDPQGLVGKTKSGIDFVTEKLMRGLGSIPETKMLRHPFYKSVYDGAQKAGYARAVERGIDVGRAEVKAGINRAAHREALKATKSTLYTIDRLSNAAVMLRFVSPFFPAFENSIRTWGRIAWQNPAVIGEGNLLWNIPNNLGWVVDKDGNKVERSNMLKDEGNFIIWPEAVANVLRDKLGPFSSGESLMTAQQGLNVVFPGGNFWFPGVGPATQIPTAWLLRGKPEDAEILRNMVGDEMFRQLVPTGNANADLVDALIPTTARRFKQMLTGDSSDTAYLTSWNQLIEDEYINAQIEGRTMTEADIKNVENKANRFWRWQIAAALVMPFQSKLASKYQLQRDEWNRLIDNEAIPYAKKVKDFLDKYPGFDAVTRSGSYSETKLQPNLSTWQKITKNPDLVNNLYEIDPELVGMFGNMGSFDDPFSYAVYGEFATGRIGSNQNRINRKMTPDEIVRNNEIKDGWSSYWKVKDYVEEKAIQAGYSSLQVKDAQGLRDVLDKAEMDLSARYPAWGEERATYTDKLNSFIQGARKIVENANLVDEDSTVAALQSYLQVREYISDALSRTDDDDAREDLRLIGYEAAFKLRQKDIGFADFYDQYLYRDDFRKV